MSGMARLFIRLAEIRVRKAAKFKVLLFLALGFLVRGFLC